MKNIIAFLVLINIVSISQAQKPQSVAYIDMEYILENVPEYLAAQNTLDAKVAQWKKKLDDQARFIEVLKTDLANEKAILTKDLIEEKEEEISLKQEELRRLESLYFGPNGDMFNLRKQMVQPVQDQIYNAIQVIAAKRKYDFVFDKSSEPIMLYSNKKYDISELILATINKDRKIEEINEKRNNPKLDKRQEELLAAKKEAISNRLKEKEATRKKIKEKRAKALELRLEKRRILKEKQEAQRKKKEDERKKKLEELKKKQEQNKKDRDNQKEN